MLLFGTRAPRSGPVRLCRTLLLAAVCILVAGTGTYAIDSYLSRQKLAQRFASAAAAESNQPDYVGRGRSSAARARTMMNMMSTEKLPLGELAADFSLLTALDQRRVHLADFRGQKPVVLLFGSFGCDLFCADLDRLKKIHKSYQGRAEFLLVHISDGGHKVLPPFTGSEPESDLARIQRGLRHFRLTMSCVLDDSDHTVEEAYYSFPRRLVAVDCAGRMTLDLGRGLGGDPWDLDGLEQWLKNAVL
jgi:hypothetical protein